MRYSFPSPRKPSSAMTRPNWRACSQCVQFFVAWLPRLQPALYQDWAREEVRRECLQSSRRPHYRRGGRGGGKSSAGFAAGCNLRPDSRTIPSRSSRRPHCRQGAMVVATRRESQPVVTTRFWVRWGGKQSLGVRCTAIRCRPYIAPLAAFRYTDGRGQGFFASNPVVAAVNQLR
jgi:hypothetical protein